MQAEEKDRPELLRPNFLNEALGKRNSLAAIKDEHLTISLQSLRKRFSVDIDK